MIYTINKSPLNFEKIDIEDHLFQHLNNSKTLVSNVSTGILQEQNATLIVLLQTYVSRFRENFDDMIF